MYYAIVSTEAPWLAYSKRSNQFVDYGFRTRFRTEELARQVASTLSEPYQICFGEKVIYDSGLNTSGAKK